ncbi:MAG: DUF1571 domain-containing protein, partial [Planctomycetes bacterium]|nr:DUF1571 domain-containing protein [Planctomycetota bacterium]
MRTWLAGACAGVLIGGVVIAQPPKTEPARAPEAPRITGESLSTMLADARTALGKVRDYTCTFTRQEMRNGTLSGEQVAEMKVRSAPAGVYVRFARPEKAAGMEIAYTGTRKDQKMRYRSAGVDGNKGFRTVDLDDAKFLAENRHPVTEWTMAAIVVRVAAVAKDLEMFLTVAAAARAGTF